MKKALIPALTALVLAAGATPALAGTTACSGATTSPIFSAWGDVAAYAPFQGAGFESGASGWSWGGKASIVSGDDGLLVGASGSHAVSIPAGGFAKSPWLCVDSTMPSMRFMVRRVSGTGSLVVLGTLAGKSGLPLTTVATVTGSGAWQPSDVVYFPSSLTSLVASGGLNAQFQFVADAGTVYRIDDVYMDPYKTR
jgi:hypothetical protein